MNKKDYDELVELADRLMNPQSTDFIDIGNGDGTEIRYDNIAAAVYEKYQKRFGLTMSWEEMPQELKEVYIDFAKDICAYYATAVLS